MEDAPRHLPVLLAEVLELLAVKPGGSWVDGTLGLGGHAEAVLERSSPDGRLLGLDRDPAALALARTRLARFGDRLRTEHADFRALPELLKHDAPDGILLDLGVSSMQLDDPTRGFSFRADGPIDMRLDPTRGEPASELVNRLNEFDLADLIYRFGEEHRSRRIARAIVSARPLNSTTALAEVVRRAAGRPRRGIDNATLTFQALRIATNGELDELGATLEQLAHRLAPGGRLAVIAFHSLEDRVVKHTFRALAARGFSLLTRKPVVASAEEERANPRARSAKLRVLRRDPAMDALGEAA
ncbi:MAG: 16S rRNA (cytosine(1402)-N(4))-methyltransferase RsmH [Vicinamibacteria bacterium]|nr:16S rRNA (cytosine(1402)-N(4))-methyltransferase RsmH [Vicinamibacteria bacterium]